METRLRLAGLMLLVLLTASLHAVAAEVASNSNSLHLAGATSAVNGMTISSGHLTLQFASGSAARVLIGDRPVGMFFKGSGTLQYEAAEPTELPLVRFNNHANAHLTANIDGKHGLLSEPIAEALVIKEDGALPELAANAGTPLSDAFAEHEKLFARAKDALPATSARTSAEISGGPDNLVYVYDSVDTLEESLSVLRPPAYAQEDSRLASMLFPVTISSQPIGHDRKVTPRPPFALTDLNYTLIADGENANLEVTETIYRPNTSRASLRFDLQDEIYWKPNRPTRKVNLRKVTDEQGRDLGFVRDRDSVIVDLSGVAAQTLKLKFVIDGDFLVREGGDNAWVLNGDWVPLPPTLNGQAYTVHALVKVKKPFVPIVPGKTVKRAEEGDFNTVETSIDHPVMLDVALAGKYTMVEDTRNGITVRVASYGIPRPRASKQLIDLAFGMIDYYQYFLGPFPFPEYNIVQVNSYGFGIAPPAMMFITNEAFDPVIDEFAKYFSEGINERFAHEIAHQYWGHAVKAPSREEWWLAESFAEYSAALALKKLQSEAVYNRLVNHWRAGAKESTSVAPIPYADRIGGDPGLAFTHRFNLLYAKGPYLLYTLHKQLGDTQFLTFMKSYQKSFQWKFGTTNDVAGLLQFMTKTDFRPFLDQYFWGTALPN
jgi:hypothetical protein